MDMSFSDFVSLVQAIIWPVVVVTVVLIFRRELPKLVQALSGRISRLSTIGVTFEFAALELATETLRVLNEIREPSSTGPPPLSGVPSLLELAKASPPADYLIIDMRDGCAWLTSRLYLFAIVLAPVLALRCFVFVGTRGPVPRYFLGLASPKSVALALERCFPWLRRTMVETQLEPLIKVGPVIEDQDPKYYVSWRPYGNTEAALKRLIQQSDRFVWDLPQAEALDEVVRALVSPIDLSMPGQVETFVNRFLQNPNLRRPRKAPPLEEDWVQLGAAEEHARWIKDERDLLDLIGDDLCREQIFDKSTTDDEFLEKTVLQKRGTFVAVTDSEGRFNRLIDRTALLERVAAGKYK